jgi:hypothetical protein
VKTLESIKADWKWGPPEGSRELDRLLDRQLTFCEKLEWLEEAETLSLHLRANREARSNDNTPPMWGEVSNLEKLQGQSEKSKD